MQLSGHACYWILHSALLSHELKCKRVFSLCDSSCGLSDASSSIICTSCHYSSTKSENAVNRGEVILQISKLLREAVLQVLSPHSTAAGSALNSSTQQQEHLCHIQNCSSGHQERQKTTVGNRFKY